MQNFVFLPFVDTFHLAASLYSRAGEFSGVETRTLPLRGLRKGKTSDDVYVYSRAAQRWPELKWVLLAIEATAERVAQGSVVFGRVYMEWLDAGAVVPWQSLIGTERFWRLHLAVRTNPGAMLYSGTESVQLLPGQLAQVEVRVPHSALNLGDSPRVHLVVDVRKVASPPQSE